jgi:hypothetical protein
MIKEDTRASRPRSGPRVEGLSTSADAMSLSRLRSGSSARVDSGPVGAPPEVYGDDQLWVMGTIMGDAGDNDLISVGSWTRVEDREQGEAPGRSVP